MTKARPPKFKMSVTKKKKTADRLVKLKSSSWYEGAARSIGISKAKPFEKRDNMIR